MTTRFLATVSAVLLMGALAWANAQPSVAGLIRPPWDLLAHGGTFFVLAGLLAVALGRERLWLALIIAIAYAMFDELRQFELQERTASITDFVSDLSGIALGALVGFLRGDSLELSTKRESLRRDVKDSKGEKHGHENNL